MTAQGQTKLEALQARIKTLGDQLTELERNIEAKRKAAGEAMLQNTNTEALENEILREESRLQTIAAALKGAKAALPSAIEEADKAKRADALARVKAIRRELDNSVDTLEQSIEGTLALAEVFSGLLAEAWSLHSRENVPLDALGTWLNLETPFCNRDHLDLILSVALQRIREHKPKA